MPPCPVFDTVYVHLCPGDTFQFYDLQITQPDTFAFVDGMFHHIAVVVDGTTYSVINDTIVENQLPYTFNGQTFYDESGNMVGYSIDSVFGNGQNFYNANGQHVGYSIDSIVGNGQNLYSDESGHVGYTVDSVFGNGQNIYMDDGKRGYSVDSVFGNGQSFYGDADPTDYFGGTDTDYDDHLGDL